MDNETHDVSAGQAEATRSGRRTSKGNGAVEAKNGFFPLVMGRDVRVSQAGGAIFLAGDEIEINQGGGQWLIALKELEVERGGGAVLISGKAEVENGFIGLLVSGRTELKGNARVLLTLPLAIAAGLAAGAAWATARFLLERRQQRVPRVTAA